MQLFIVRKDKYQHNNYENCEGFPKFFWNIKMKHFYNFFNFNRTIWSPPTNFSLYFNAVQYPKVLTHKFI